jgi:hypothetical protein
VVQQVVEVALEEVVGADQLVVEAELELVDREAGKEQLEAVLLA